MYKAGDEVLIKAEITDVVMVGTRPYFVKPDSYSINWVSEDKIIPMDKTYTKGLADAWELAKRLFDFELDEREKMLGYQSMKAILEDLTPEYVMDRIEVYENEKEIKVGDVVEFSYETEEPKEKGVVTWVLENGVSVVWGGGETEHCKKTELTKTGKHIDIESLLKQIGE
jgi:hypothetical protein